MIRWRLLADAGHNLSDVVGLAVAWVGAGLSRRPPTRRFTWGYRGATILASLGNSLLLLVALGAIAWEALNRLAAPPPAPANVMMLVAAAGVAINLGTALLFVRGRQQRPQHPRRLSAHGGRRRRLGGRGRGRAGDPARPAPTG